MLVTRTTWDKPNYCPEVCKELDEPTDRIMVPGQFVEYMGPDRNVVEGFTLRKGGVGLSIAGNMHQRARVLALPEYMVFDIGAEEMATNFCNLRLS